MRRGVEVMSKSTSAKNGHERIVTDRENSRHLEYFNNGQWRHSEKCREFTNKDCKIKKPKQLIVFFIIIPSQYFRVFKTSIRRMKKSKTNNNNAERDPK